MEIKTKFDIQQKVIILGDRSVVAVVQRITISVNTAMYGVAWFNGAGDWKEVSFYEWQLSCA